MPAMWDYDGDVLASDPHRRTIPEMSAEPGLLVELRDTGFVGRVVRATATGVTLRDRRGRERTVGLHPASFIVDDRIVSLVAPTPPPPGEDVGEPVRTASGSFALPGAAARVARPDRILVEGRHDAELLERIWGDDLRIEGLAVEYLEGIDDLDDVVRAFDPGPARRLGVLVDHLVPGTKEHRIASGIRHPDVLVTGHPFVDVWAAVKPEVMGIDAWPAVPHGRPWKEGVCEALGYGHPAELWRELLGRVRRYTDLDRSLVGAVEQLIDFATGTR